MLMLVLMLVLILAFVFQLKLFSGGFGFVCPVVWEIFHWQVASAEGEMQKWEVINVREHNLVSRLQEEGKYWNFKCRLKIQGRLGLADNPAIKNTNIAKFWLFAALLVEVVL